MINNLSSLNMTTQRQLKCILYTSFGRFIHLPACIRKHIYIYTATTFISFINSSGIYILYKAIYATLSLRAISLSLCRARFIYILSIYDFLRTIIKSARIEIFTTDSRRRFLFSHVSLVAAAALENPVTSPAEISLTFSAARPL